MIGNEPPKLSDFTTGRRSLTRRTVIAGAAATAGAAALTGCGPSAGGADIELNVWGGVPGDAGPDDLVEEFHRQHPDIKVTYTRYVNNDEGNLKLDTSLQGGVPIDVFFSYGAPALAKRTGAGLAVDLTDRINGDHELADFRADADPISNYVLDGKTYCLPASLGPMFVFLNETMLKQQGIELGESWSVEEFEEVAGRLSEVGQTFGSFNAPAIARPSLGPDCNYADGGEASNFDAPEWRRELDLSLRMQEKRATMPREQVLAEKLKTFSQTPFLTGRTAMVIGYGHLTRYISDTKEFPHDFRTVCMPPPNPHAGGGPYWNEGGIGDLMSISQKSKHQDAAWAFVKFWSANGGRYTGRLPFRTEEDSTAEVMAKFLGPEAETLYDVESFERFLFHSDLRVTVDSIFTAATQLDQIRERLTDEVLLGDRTVDSWVTEAVAQADAAIRTAS